MPAGNFIIIAIVLTLVISGGLWVFFWWRSKYGVWAQEREATRQRDDGKVTVIDTDPNPWHRVGGALGAHAAMQAGQDAADRSNSDPSPSRELFDAGGTSSEPGLGSGGDFDSSASSGSGGGSGGGGDSSSGGGGGDS